MGYHLRLDGTLQFSSLWGCSRTASVVKADTEAETIETVSTATTDTTDVADTADTAVVDTIDTGTVDTSDIRDTATADTANTADTATVDTADITDTAKADTADTETMDTADTETIDTADTATADTADTETMDTADTETMDTADTETMDTADTETIDTADTATADTADTETADTADTETMDTGDTETTDTSDTETTDTADTETTDTADTETADTADTSIVVPPVCEQTSSSGNIRCIEDWLSLSDSLTTNICIPRETMALNAQVSADICGSSTCDDGATGCNMPIAVSDVTVTLDDVDSPEELTAVLAVADVSTEIDAVVDTGTLLGTVACNYSVAMNGIEISFDGDLTAVDDDELSVQVAQTTIDFNDMTVMSSNFLCQAMSDILKNQLLDSYLGAIEDQISTAVNTQLSLISCVACGSEDCPLACVPAVE